MDRLGTSKPTLLDYASAMFAVIAASYILLPRNHVKVLNEMNNSFAMSVRAATGGTVIKDLRSTAERFNEEALKAIASFWEGF